MTDFINHAIENPVLPAIFIVLLAMLLTSIFRTQFRQYKEVDVTGAVSLINSEHLVILDVREAKERKSGHINKDKHIPMANVADKLASLDKNKPILVYCHSGSRSASIAQTLGKAQFDTYNLKGGFNAWLGANMPVAKK